MSDLRSERIVLVGGRGFLGRHIATALRAASPTVVGTTRCHTADRDLRQMDLVGGDSGSIRSVLREIRPTAVVNCSGTTGGSVKDLTDGNVVAPARLLLAIKEVAPSARYVHLGSAAEYGGTVTDRPVCEDDEPKPSGAYGVSKLAGTRAALAMSADLSLDATVLRVFNPLGAGAPITTLPGRLVRLLRTVERDEPVSVGPLQAYRDFVDVRDVAAAVVACLGSRPPAGRIYNVAGGRAVRARVLVDVLAETAGFTGDIREEHEGSDRSGGLLWQQADIHRAEREIGWSPRYTLRESVACMWELAG